MTQAHSHHGHLAQELFQLRDHGLILGRIAGSVREDHTVRLAGEDILGGSAGRDHRHRAANGLQGADEGAADAIVHQRHMELLLALGVMERDGLAGGILHGLRNGIALNHREVSRNLIADHGVHHAVFPDDAGELTGIHAPDAGDVLRLEIGIQIILGAEIGGRRAPLAHDVALHQALALEVLLDDAVVADQGIGVHDDLACKGRISQGLDVAAHAGGEHQFTDRIGLGTEAVAFKYPAILQYQIAFFHGLLLVFAL